MVLKRGLCRQLRACIVFAEDPNLVNSILVRWLTTTCNTSSRFNALFWHLRVHEHTPKNKKEKEKEKEEEEEEIIKLDLLSWPGKYQKQKQISFNRPIVRDLRLSLAVCFLRLMGSCSQEHWDMFL